MCSKCAKWIHIISCWKTRELGIQIGFNDNEFDEIILLILSFISILVFVLPNPLSDDDSYFTTPVFSVKIQIFGDSFFSTFLLKSGDWKSICTQSKVSIFRDRSVIDSSFIVTLKASWWGFNENKSRLIESSEKNIFISPNKRIEWAKRTSEIMAKYKYFTNEWDQKGFIFIKPEPGGF